MTVTPQRDHTPSKDVHAQTRKTTAVLEELFPSSVQQLDLVSRQSSEPQQQQASSSSEQDAVAPPPSVSNLLGLGQPASQNSDDVALDLRRSENLWQQRAEMQRTTEMIAQQASQWRLLFEKLAGAVDTRVDIVDNKLAEFISSQNEKTQKMMTVQDATRRADREDILSATDLKLSERLEMAVKSVDDTFKKTNEMFEEKLRNDGKTNKELIELKERNIVKTVDDKFSKLENLYDKNNNHLVEQVSELSLISKEAAKNFSQNSEKILTLSKKFSTLKQSSDSLTDELKELKEHEISTLENIKSLDSKFSTDFKKVRDLVEAREKKMESNRQIVLQRLDGLEVSARQALELAQTLQTNLDLSSAAARSAQKSQAGLSDRLARLEQIFQEKMESNVAEKAVLLDKVKQLESRLASVESKSVTQGTAIGRQAQDFEDLESGLEKMKLRLKEETKKRISDANVQGMRVRRVEQIVSGAPSFCWELPRFTESLSSCALNKKNIIMQRVEQAGGREAVDALDFASKQFKEIFEHPPQAFGCAPGRVELLGNHTEWNEGMLLSCAIDRHTFVLGRKVPPKPGDIHQTTRIKSSDPFRDKLVTIKSDAIFRGHSSNFIESWMCSTVATSPAKHGKPASHRPKIPHASHGDRWANYVLGVVDELNRECERRDLAPLQGMDLYIHSLVPPGCGVASSAALEVATACCLRELFGQLEALDQKTMVQVCRNAEINFVGVSCGIMDQLTSFCGKKNHAMALDCEHCTEVGADWELIKFNFNEPVSLVLATINKTGTTESVESSESEQNSPLPNSLSRAKSDVETLRQKVNEAKKIFNIVKPQGSASDLRTPKQKLKTMSLSTVTLDDLESTEHKLQREVADTIKHVITENKRVKESMQALENQDLFTFANCMIDSHESQRLQFGNTCCQLEYLAEATFGEDGWHGGRLMGGGSGGCTINIVDMDCVDSFTENVKTKYMEHCDREPFIQGESFIESQEFSLRGFHGLRLRLYPTGMTSADDTPQNVPMRFLLPGISLFTTATAVLYQETQPEQALAEFINIWQARTDGHEDVPGDDTRIICTWGWSHYHETFMDFFLSKTADKFDSNGKPWTSLLILGMLKNQAELFLNSDFAERFGYDRVFIVDEKAGGNKCDFVFISAVNSSTFTVNKMLPLLPAPPKKFVYAFTNANCMVNDEFSDWKFTAQCNHINVQYENTYLMIGGGVCMGDVCVSNISSERLQDPLEPNWNCQNYDGDVFNASEAETAEFGQDYFIYRNFFRDYKPLGKNGKGLYVDIGAHMPFEYSNTAFFDKCLDWDGVCVEPNPDTQPFFFAYRSCNFYQNCIFSETEFNHHFALSKDELENGGGFTADCISLEDLLLKEKLQKPEVIDFLSVDVENAGLSVIKKFPFENFDIKVVLFEVEPGTQWMEFDMIFLRNDFVKMAVIGRDCVYVHLSVVREMGNEFLPQRFTWPYNWEDFQYKVLEDEKAAVSAGNYPSLFTQ
eukprot:gene825-871_t